MQQLAILTTIRVPSQYKDVVFTSIGIPMSKIRRSPDRLIFNMGIPIHGKDSLYFETVPRSLIRELLSVITSAERRMLCFHLCWFVSLLLAKIWQVCSSDGLSLRLSVCLFVRMNVVSRIQVAPFDQSSRNFSQTCILVRDRNPFVFLVKGQATRSWG